MKEVTVIIGIGFDNSDDPAAYYDDVLRVVNRLGVLNARILGDSYSPKWGDEPGAWIAATFPNVSVYGEARERISAIGAAHNQDAIAFTTGHTHLVQSPPARRAREYRDFL